MEAGGGLQSTSEGGGGRRCASVTNFTKRFSE